ncbi:imidazole glycerol phosphate synthase subunit HisH [Candidatus Woesearchaeota archaeon]|nr:imidazole glycerol phosphate synthase subunit HisH [Candidatus Woesearchaeota archaeon]
MIKMIIVIDYGAGNLKSVTKALDALGVKNKVTSKAKDIEKADKIILPGVGNFGDMMKSLKKKKLIEPIKKAIKSNKPYLGICLGLQALFEESEESPGVKGLGILKGKVKRFKPKNLKIPQIGWNSINIKKKSKLLRNVKDASYVYFVHSYYVNPRDSSIVLATTDYGVDFVSSVCKGNICATQFHPEKSGSVGMQILSNFVGAKSVEAVLFDMDGVLVDSYEAWFRLFNFTLKYYGKKEVTKSEFDRRAWAQDIGVVANRFIPEESVSDVAGFYFSNFPRFKDYVKTLPNTKETLTILKRMGIKLGVVTNTFRALARKMLESAGLDGLFDIVVGGDDVKKGKPEPDIVFFGCESLGVKPYETILVGDTNFDLKAGKKAGCRTVGFRVDNDIRIDDIKKMLELV